jgi:hypothetical protein
MENNEHQELIPCPNCGRKFLEDRLEVHLRACKPKEIKKNSLLTSTDSNNLFLKNLEKQMQNEPETSVTKETNTKPAKKNNLAASVDSKNLFLEKLEKQMQNEGEAVTTTTVKPKKNPLATSTESNNLFLEKLEKQMKNEKNETGEKPNRPITLICYVCGKEFGTQSLNFHLKTCEANYLRDKKYLPEKPAAHDTILNKKNLDYQEVCQYNQEAEKIFKDVNHHPCPNCGRKFLADRLEVHLKGCKPKEGVKNAKSPDRKNMKSPERKNVKSPERKNDINVNSTKLLEEKLNKQLQGGGGKSSGMSGGGMNSGGFGNKPLFLMCYCCGREFGKHSLEIHMKTCLEKFANEEKGKRKMPNMPEELEKLLSNLAINGDITNDEIASYNDIANNMFKEYSMKKCPGCNRRFLPDRLEVHLKSCKEAGSGSERMAGKSPNMNSRPKMLMCPLCGREFGTMSLSIHIKTCRTKFEIEQTKLPKNLRRSADKIIEKFEETNKAIQSGGGAYNLDKMNEVAYDMYSKEALVPCENCGRTFLPDRLLVHQRSCKKK